MESKRVLVTGGFGFIGKVLLKTFLKELDEIDYIDVIDNLCNSVPFDKDTLSLFNGKLSFCKSTVADWLPSRKYTEIYHLASPVGPAGVLNYAGSMGPMIISDTYKMANLALKDGARFIDISTSEVYGRDPGSTAQKESIDKIVPSNVTVRLEYGVSKLACEVFLLNMVKVSPLQINIIRPFNIVGPSQSGKVGFVLPRFIEQAMKGKDLTVFGDGLQKRTFTSVFDFVSAIKLVMNSKETNAEIFNVGNPDNLYSILDLANIVIKATGSKSKVLLINPKEIYGKFYEEAWNKIPDISKIQSTLGWKPKDDISKIVSDAIEVYMSNNK